MCPTQLPKTNKTEAKLKEKEKEKKNKNKKNKRKKQHEIPSERLPPKRSPASFPNRPDFLFKTIRNISDFPNIQSNKTDPFRLKN